MNRFIKDLPVRNSYYNPDMDELAKKSTQGVLQFLVALALLIFLPAWTIYFWQGWIYFAVFAVSASFITLYFLRRDPELIKRRLSAGPAAEKEKSQRIIQTFSGFAVIALIAVSSLDRRLGISSVPAAFVIFGNIIVAAGFGIVFLVFRENSFTSAIVEVATGQKVVATGPYAVVRHPMYAGAALLFLFTPPALGSYISLPLSLVLVVLLCARIVHEEHYLKEHLKGYREYAKKIPYRMIPFLF